MAMLALWTLLPFFLSACEPAPQQEQGPKYERADSRPAGTEMPVYRFAIHPLHNPRKLTQAYQPLIDYLSSHIPGVRFQLEASRDYPAYEAKFRAREAEFLLPNPWQTLEAMKVGYQVIAMAGDAEDFKGIFIVRKDGGIRKPADLKGRAVSFPSPTALAATIMPQFFLHQQGVDVNRDIDNRYVGSQESSIMNVHLRQVAAGGTWPPPWRAFEKDHPQEAAELMVIWETPSLMNNSVMVRDDVPSGVRDQVRRLLSGLDKAKDGEEVLAAMETARFHEADNASYERVREFVARFEREVRPVEAK